MEYNTLQLIQTLASSASMLMANAAQSTQTQRTVDATLVLICQQIDAVLLKEAQAKVTADLYSGRDPV